MGQKTENILERAKVNLEKDNHENALRLLNEVLNREPSHREALRNKSLIKVLNASKQEAEEFLLFAIEQQPEDDQLYQILGTFYHNNDAPSKALAQLTKAIEINDSNFLALKGLGTLYAQYYNEHEKAVSYFSKALELNKNAADVYFNRGCSHMVLKNFEKAEKDLRRSSDLGNTKASEMVEKYFE